MSRRSADPLVKVEGLKKYFYQNTSLLDRLDPNTKKEKIHAVDDIDLTIEEGEVLGIVGESGCGKSTLARTMLRLIDASDGHVELDGENIMKYSGSELRKFRRRAQLIHQDPFGSLNPRHTVRRIIRAPLKIHDICDSTQEREKRIRELMETVNLDSEYLDKYPHQMSGGQNQRVAIARALAVEPDLLVADEPTSTLDASVQARILNLLDELKEQRDLTIVFITHDLSVVNYITDRVVVMYLGQIVEEATKDQIFEDPKHPYTQTLFSSIPVADPAKSRGRIQLKGTVPSPINPPSGCRFHTRCPKQIPPTEWTGSQEAWLDVYNVKQALQAEIDEESESDRQVEIEPTIEGVLSSARADLSQRAIDVLTDVRERYAEAELEEAKDRLTAEFVSPCEETAPEIIQEGTNQDVRCLLYGDQTEAAEPLSGVVR